MMGISCFTSRKKKTGFCGDTKKRVKKDEDVFFVGNSLGKLYRSNEIGRNCRDFVQLTQLVSTGLNKDDRSNVSV